MHGNMVFSRDSIFSTPQQSGCLCVCSDNKNLRLWAEPEPVCVLFLLIILLPCMILDLGDCETLSTDYMKVHEVRFFPRLIGRFRGVDYL